MELVRRVLPHGRVLGDGLEEVESGRIDRGFRVTAPLRASRASSYTFLLAAALAKASATLVRKNASCLASFRSAGRRGRRRASALRTFGEQRAASVLPSASESAVRSSTVRLSSAQTLSNAAWSNFPTDFSHASALAFAASGVAVRAC